jgi:hypothetical protein
VRVSAAIRSFPYPDACQPRLGQLEASDGRDAKDSHMRQSLRRNQSVIPNESFPRCLDALFAVLCEGDVGGASVTAVERPLRLTVTDDETARGGHRCDLRRESPIDRVYNAAGVWKQMRRLEGGSRIERGLLKESPSKAVVGGVARRHSSALTPSRDNAIAQFFCNLDGCHCKAAA